MAGLLDYEFPIYGNGLMQSGHVLRYGLDFSIRHALGDEVHYLILT